MRGFRFEVSCPGCGGEVFQLAPGRVCAGTETSSVCRCLGCGWEWQVQVTLRRVQSMAAVRKRRHREMVS